MNSYGGITRIGGVLLWFVVLAVAGSPALALEDVRGIRGAGPHQRATHDMMEISGVSDKHQRFQSRTTGRSVQAIPRGNLSRAGEGLDSLTRRRSQTILPLILYPWIWGYNYGEMQTPDGVLVEYLEELYDRQAKAKEEDLPPAPPVPASPPLIIEEQCGQYVTIPWPESGVLFEPREEDPTCPPPN